VSKDCLIIFTRYPQPSQVKTRLIPALGAAGAAALHRRMTEHTLAQVRALRQTRALSIEVWFTGGTLAQVQEWLGTDVEYFVQPEGDLGDRMAFVFKSVFSKGYTAAVIVGTDCPDLNTALLAQGFSALAQHDLVLGPAIDGGYYLIGLQRLVPELFGGIAWSTGEVLEKTLAIAQQLALASVLLPYLSDIDVPQDLEHPSVQALLSKPLDKNCLELKDSSGSAQNLKLFLSEKLAAF
jgi:uncharacterized protein